MLGEAVGVDEAVAAAAVRVEGAALPTSEDELRLVPTPVAICPARGDESGAANAVGDVALFTNESLLWFCAEAPSFDGTVGASAIFVVLVGDGWLIIDEVCSVAVAVVAGRRISLWGFFAPVLPVFWSDDGITRVGARSLFSFEFTCAKANGWRDMASPTMVADTMTRAFLCVCSILSSVGESKTRMVLDLRVT